MTDMTQRAQQMFSKETLIPVGLVATFLASIAGVGYAWGITNSKVEKLDSTVTEQSDLLRETREELVEVKTTNKQLLQALQDLKSNFNGLNGKIDQISQSGR